jgi:hypothetical protein
MQDDLDDDDTVTVPAAVTEPKPRKRKAPAAPVVVQVLNGATGAVLLAELAIDGDLTAKRARDFVEDELHHARGSVQFFAPGAGDAPAALVLHKSTQRVKNALKGVGTLLVMPNGKKKKRVAMRCVACRANFTEGPIYRSRVHGSAMCDKHAKWSSNVDEDFVVYQDVPARWNRNCCICKFAVWGDLFYDPHGHAYCEAHVDQFGAENKAKFFTRSVDRTVVKAFDNVWKQSNIWAVGNRANRHAVSERFHKLCAARPCGC